MSKASEWTDNEPFLKHNLEPNSPLQTAIALVERGGGLYLEINHTTINGFTTSVGMSLSATAALNLMFWIRDTFQERQ